MRSLVALPLVALAVAAAILVGRWEAGRHARAENEGIARVRADVGPLRQPSLDAYRRGPGFDCLGYRRGGRPLALELCADGAGRVVEAIDRRAPGDPSIWSIREDPGRASVRLDRETLDRLLHTMGAS